MPISRRDFVRAGMVAAAVAAVPRPLVAQLGPKPEPLPPIGDPRLKALISRALDSARSAGATYVDARLTHDRVRRAGGFIVRDSEAMYAGVRALVDGYWGFASGSVWSPDEMARLGREAAAQAKTNALGKRRIVDLAPTPAIRDGNWAMPVEIDPFEVAPNEVVDVLAGLQVFASRTPGVAVISNECEFFAQDKAFGSSDLGYFTQSTYLTSGSFAFTVSAGGKSGGGALERLDAAGIGWELYRVQPLREEIRRTIEDIKNDLALPIKPIDVGRYDSVFDARSVATLALGTLGRASELDRALGYEANDTGTSYLNEPFEMMGSYEAGAPLLTLTGNRSERGGCATVRWDDEGVTPDEFPIVKDGVLVDFQTMRESAGWLKDAYAKSGKQVRSHGCAAAPSALSAPLQYTPNLVLAPGRDTQDFDALVTGLTNGIAVRGVTGPEIDFQCLNGFGRGRTYEVKRGKRVAMIAGAGFLFRAPELWKGLLALGGEASMRRIAAVSAKGEPRFGMSHTVTAPPALFKQVTFIDPMRKA
jgi:TldD protein